MEDQITCFFIFKITPTQILKMIPQSKSTNLNYKSSHKKQSQSILFKLGNSEGKCLNLGDSVEIKTSVLYSKTLNKFCPIKGLVKIYDRNKDGVEMISCVGAFNTDQLLNPSKIQKEKNTLNEEIELTRNIGPCSLTMKIKVSKVCDEIENQSESNLKKKTDSVENKPRQRINSTSSSHSSKRKNSGQEYAVKNKQSIDRINQSELSINSDYKNDGLKNLGQQLINERKLTKKLQQQIQDLLAKNKNLRRQLANCNQSVAFVEKYKIFSDLFCFGQTNISDIVFVKEKQKEVILKYKKNDQNIMRKIAQFIDFGQKKIKQYDSSYMVKQDEQKKQGSMIKGVEHQIILEKDTQIATKNRQLRQLQAKYQKQVQDIQSLSGMNQYLQQKDSQMQSIILQKENQIEEMKKVMAINRQQINILQDKNHQLVRITENLELTVEEVKQDLANSAQIIENYRRKYGDLKENKDRTVQRDLRECLHWIDQYHTEDQLSMMEDTTNNSLSHNLSQNDSNTNNAMTSIMMKSIGLIEDMPLEQISQIRREVISVLKKLDQLLARSSI